MALGVFIYVAVLRVELTCMATWFPYNDNKFVDISLPIIDDADNR